MEAADRVVAVSHYTKQEVMAQYGIPAVTMSDGPHGVRCQKNGADMLGVNESEPATCFPTAVTSGATWDAELLKAEGQAIGEEGLSYGVDVVLGPGVNIKRNPLCGRNFEYFSEDPCIAGAAPASSILPPTIRSTSGSTATVRWMSAPCASCTCLHLRLWSRLPSPKPLCAATRASTMSTPATTIGC
mgnify:CR=1 FL=1